MQVIGQTRKARLGRKARLDPLGRRAQPVHKGRRVRRVRPDLLVQRARRDQPALRVQPGQQDQPALRVQAARPARLDRRDRPEPARW